MRSWSGALPFFLLAFLLALAPGASAGQASPARAAAAFNLVETTDEVRVETTAYVLAVTREGFGWTLRRPGGQVLTSAPAGGPTPNGALVVDGGERPAGKLKAGERGDDPGGLGYQGPARKNARRVELEPMADRVRVTTIGLHRDPGLGALVSCLRFALGWSARWYGGGFQGWRSKLVLPL